MDVCLSSSMFSHLGPQLAPHGRCKTADAALTVHLGGERSAWLLPDALLENGSSDELTVGQRALVPLRHGSLLQAASATKVL